MITNSASSVAEVPVGGTLRNFVERQLDDGPLRPGVERRHVRRHLPWKPHDASDEGSSLLSAGIEPHAAVEEQALSHDVSCRSDGPQFLVTLLPAWLPIRVGARPLCVV